MYEWFRVAKTPRKYDRLPISVMTNSMDKRGVMCRIRSIEDVVRIIWSIYMSRYAMTYLF